MQRVRRLPDLIVHLADNPVLGLELSQKLDAAIFQLDEHCIQALHGILIGQYSALCYDAPIHTGELRLECGDSLVVLRDLAIEIFQLRIGVCDLCKYQLLLTINVDGVLFLLKIRVSIFRGSEVLFILIGLAFKEIGGSGGTVQFQVLIKVQLT